LVNLPDYAVDAYPVETQYTFDDYESNLSRSPTDAFSAIMLTFGNGELCSKMLYNSLNRDYMRRAKAYYSKAKEKKAKNISNYVAKDGVYIKTY